jgi:hypothetical protein
VDKMNETERQELIDRLDKAEKQLNTGFTESGRELSLMESMRAWMWIRSAKRQLGVISEQSTIF